MDAFELLKNDHRLVEDLFAQIEEASGAAKKQLFNRLKSELDVHAHVEEKIFYPALENKEESREITLEAYEEHKVVKDLLAQLAGGTPDEEWDAKLTVLKENVEHHVKEEEGELFDKAEDVLSDEQIERLGSEMEAEKGRQQGTRARGEKAPAKRAPSKAGGRKQSGGVLSRLANLVGLGGEDQKANKRSSRSTKKTASKKTSGQKSAPKKSAAKKSATKSTTKRQAGGAGKSGKKRAGSPAKKSAKSATRKTATTKTSARGGGRKKSAARKK